MSQRTIQAIHVLNQRSWRGAEQSAALLVSEMRGRLGRSHITCIREPLDLFKALVAAWRPWANRVTVVICHGGRTSYLAWVLGHLRLPQVRVIYVNISDVSRWPRRGRIRRLLVPDLPTRAHAVVSRSGQTAATFVQRYKYPAERIRVIPGGRPRPARPSPAHVRLVRQARGATSRRVVCWVGAFSSEKRPDLALAVAAAADPQSWAFILAGEGPLEAGVRRQAAAGRLEHVYLPGLLASASDMLPLVDAVLLTSSTEGLPGVAIEAVVAGRPVVGTAVGGTPAVVEDGVTGVLLPVDAQPLEFLSALVEVTDPGWSTSFRAAAMADAACRFSMETVGQAWEELLREVAQQ